MSENNNRKMIKSHSDCSEATHTPSVAASQICTVFRILDRELLDLMTLTDLLQLRLVSQLFNQLVIAYPKLPKHLSRQVICFAGAKESIFKFNEEVLSLKFSSFRFAAIHPLGFFRHLPAFLENNTQFITSLRLDVLNIHPTLREYNTLVSLEFVRTFEVGLIQKCKKQKSDKSLEEFLRRLHYFDMDEVNDAYLLSFLLPFCANLRYLGVGMVSKSAGDQFLSFLKERLHMLQITDQNLQINFKNADTMMGYVPKSRRCEFIHLVSQFNGRIKLENIEAEVLDLGMNVNLNINPEVFCNFLTSILSINMLTKGIYEYDLPNMKELKQTRNRDLGLLYGNLGIRIPDGRNVVQWKQLELLELSSDFLFHSCALHFAWRYLWSFFKLSPTPVKYLELNDTWDSECNLEIPLSEMVANFTLLKRVKITSLVCGQDIFLQVLEQLAISTCVEEIEFKTRKSFGEEIFTGYGKRQTKSSTTLLKMPKLKRLEMSCGRWGGMSDYPFCNIISKLNLEVFSLRRSGGNKKIKFLDTFTGNGLHSLVTGNFGDTIRNFTLEVDKKSKSYEKIAETIVDIHQRCIRNKSFLLPEF